MDALAYDCDVAAEPVDWPRPDATIAPARADPALTVVMWHLGRVGAGPKFTFDLADALQACEGLDVSVVASEGSDLDAACSDRQIGLDRIATFSGDKSTTLGKLSALLGLVRLPAIAFRFSRILERRRPDIALCAFQSIWDVAALHTLRRFTGRFVLVLHDAAFHIGDEYPLRQSILRRQVDAADALVVLSEHVGRQAIEAMDFPADRIWTVPHGAFAFGEPRVAARRFPADRAFRVLFLGRIVRYKGLELLLDAIARLRAKHLDVELTIAGDGDLRPYQDAIDRLGDVTVENRWLDDRAIAAALVEADVVVLPYIEASQSGVAATAMTDALPVIVTPVGGLAEQVQDGVCGLVAESVSADAVAVSIARLALDPDLYERLSRNAWRHAAEDLSWRAVATKLGGILEKVAALPPRSTGS